MDAHKQNLLDIKRILDSYEIKFWLIFGTLLGIYRNGELIPYDTDTDLAIFYEDGPMLFTSFDSFIEEGFKISCDNKQQIILTRGGVHTDIFLLKLIGKKRGWKEIMYDDSSFRTFKTIEFLGQDWRIPDDTEKWLKYTYGANWKMPIKNKGVGRGYPLGK